MPVASLRPWLLGGMLACLCAPSVSRAQDEKRSAPPPPPVTQAPRFPPSRHAIAAKDPDVAEMSKLINARIEAGWRANKLTPATHIDDHDFIRRASLDIIGRVAKVEEIRQYFRDPEATRRSLLIERLLKHEDYARHWANLWTNWLLTRNNDFGKGKYHDQMNSWLMGEFALNRPYHEIVTKLLTAKGKNSDDGNGAVNFILAHVGERVQAVRPNGQVDPGATAERVKKEGHFEMVPLTSRITRVFLGTQVQCAQCHAHPFFASLKQESFWRVNAYLRQVRLDSDGMRRRPGQMTTLPDLTLVDDESVNPGANVLYEERTGKAREKYAEFLPAPGKDRGPRLDPTKVGLARREELARHLVDHEMFPKAIVNRMWGLFFGRGFVNPIDDFNDNTQPSNPELLNELAERFKHYNYDLKKLIRWMTHSDAYYRSYVANKSNDKVEHEPLFSRMVMKSLTPEQLFESLMTATGADKALSTAEKTTMRNEWLGKLITNFGDDEGNEVTFNGTIVQALLMMNGKNINDAIASPKGTVARAMASKNDVVGELYLAALNRPPRGRDRARVAAGSGLTGRNLDSPKAAYEDLFWALLNSNEFIINH